MSGSSMTTLATLGQYGLIDRTGGNLSVSSLAVQILHPSSNEQRDKAIKDAASLPKVFQDQLNGFENCSSEIITNHLIQIGFAPDRAKKVANVYLENRKFAKLDEVNLRTDNNDDLFLNEVPKSESSSTSQQSPILREVNSSQDLSATPIAFSEGKMLAQYTIPLGENQATLVFTGTALTEEDFEALADFVEFAKKQFARKPKVKLQSHYPRAAIWKNADHDAPVTIIGEMGERDGVKYYQTSQGTGIPGSELKFA